ncbi:hypothetical protein SAMN04487847_0154 [Microbacterium sp. cf332]|nr:hypothetical protein SAMN04487847_0154 [Microbacterium sp. cf332]
MRVVPSTGWLARARRPRQAPTRTALSTAHAAARRLISTRPRQQLPPQMQMRMPMRMHDECRGGRSARCGVRAGVAHAKVWSCRPQAQCPETRRPATRRATEPVGGTERLGDRGRAASHRRRTVLVRGSAHRIERTAAGAGPGTCARPSTSRRQAELLSKGSQQMPQAHPACGRHQVSALPAASGRPPPAPARVPVPIPRRPADRLNCYRRGPSRCHKRIQPVDGTRSRFCRRRPRRSTRGRRVVNAPASRAEGALVRRRGSRAPRSRCTAAAAARSSSADRSASHASARASPADGRWRTGA